MDIALLILIIETLRGLYTLNCSTINTPICVECVSGVLWCVCCVCVRSIVVCGVCVRGIVVCVLCVVCSMFDAPVGKLFLQAEKTERDIEIIPERRERLVGVERERKKRRRMDRLEWRTDKMKRGGEERE